jgi:hypothetical protein
MLQVTRLRKGVVVFMFLASLCVFCARADVNIAVSSLNGFSPNPAQAVVGEPVFWYDSDGNGPYTIFSASGAWQTFQTDAGLIFSHTGTFQYYDDVGDTGTLIVTSNAPPSVTITNPVNQAVFSVPASFTFGADASDTDVDGLARVEFYVNTNLVGDIFSAPFTTSVTNLPAGVYTLTCIAYDFGKASATNSITITVGAAALPPTLSATTSVNQFLIAWSTNNSAGLTLKSTATLGLGASWTAVTNAPVLIGSRWVVTNAMAGASQFFRLSNQ